MKVFVICSALLLLVASAAADESPPDGVKTMSGLSLLGNQEAPKALVIVPWKGSEMGNPLEVTSALDNRARPVDRDVFMRELNFYEIRTGVADRVRSN